MIEEEEKHMEVDTQSYDNKNDHHKKKQTKEEKRGRVFIRNLPFTATEEKIKLLFEKYGKISEVNLPKKENKSKLKGYGFIQFDTKRDALKAIKVG